MPTPQKQTMYVAFELSAETWKLAISNGDRQRLVNVQARDLKGFRQQLEQSREKLGVAPTGVIYSCYEAGRDGFWLHRWLQAEGIQNRVVDPSAIQVNRRAKHIKTDRIDAQKLVAMLIRDAGGEPGVWRTCRVPTVEEEDQRQPQREYEALQEECTRVGNQTRSLLIRYGIRVEGKWPEPVEALRQANGTALPPHVQLQLKRAGEHLAFLRRQLGEIRRSQIQEVQQGLGEGAGKTAEQKYRQKVAQKTVKLMSLKGIGLTSALLFVTEFFGWREFHNRKEVGGAAGLDGAPFNSGNGDRDQGISKAGNRRIRDMAVEIGWAWVRYQPNSELTRWFLGHAPVTAKRLRKKSITALARRLLIALWRYLEQDIVPEGAQLKELIALK